MSSLSVLDDFVVGGSLSLGDATDALSSAAALELNSVLTGWLRFEGKSAGSGVATMLPGKASLAWSIGLPDAASGTVMTSGQLPALQRLSVLSQGSLKQRLDALDHVTIGTALGSQPLHAVTPVDGREPLGFAGRVPLDGRQTRLLASSGRPLPPLPVVAPEHPSTCQSRTPTRPCPLSSLASHGLLAACFTTPPRQHAMPPLRPRSRLLCSLGPQLQTDSRILNRHECTVGTAGALLTHTHTHTHTHTQWGQQARC